MPKNNINQLDSSLNYNNPSHAYSNTETNAAKLALLGGLLSTLGDALSTIAAALALEELRESDYNTPNNDDKINELERKIEYLMKEIKNQ